MQFLYKCKERPMVIKITVKRTSSKPPRVRLIVEDYKKINTKYMDRYSTIEKNTESFFIRLPISPVKARIFLYSENGGSFKVVKKEILSLKTQMSSFDFGNPDISKFVIFSQEFSCKAGYLSAGTYFNKSGEYQIDYLPKIKNQAGIELNTPARINARMGIVQVNQRIFKDYTVSGRFAILLHEFCHVFANDNIRDEIEADYHAAQIYLALGYPRVEILNVFANVFLRADNDLNRTRFKKLYEFIMNFDDKIQAIKYN